MRHFTSSLARFLYPAALLSLACAAMLTLASPAKAQEQHKIVLSQDEFKESYLDKVTVSGGIRAGFMQQSSLAHVDLKELSIQLLRDVTDPKAMLFVNMVSRDGRYTASWKYPLGPIKAGDLLVSIPSKYNAKLAGYAPDALVVLAAVCDKDCPSGLHYVPAGWGPPNGNNYVLYINSGNTDTSVAVPGMKDRTSCTKINADSTIAYDTACTVSKELMNSPKSLYLLRNNFGKRLPNVEIPVQ